MPLVLPPDPQFLDALARSIVDGFALEVCVDVVVGDAQGLFIGEGGAIVLEVRGRDLRPRGLGGAEVAQKEGALPFGEPVEGEEVGRAVAVFGEEAGDVLCGVVGAHDEEPQLPGQGVLGDHALPGLEVPAVEIAEAFLAEHTGDFCFGGARRLGDVDRHAVVGLDESERPLRIVFVRLDPVGKSDGPELRVPAAGAVLLYGELGQAASQRRILAAGDSQHETAGSGGGKVVNEKGAPPQNFLCRIDPPANMQGGGDVLADFFGRRRHDFTLMERERHERRFRRAAESARGGALTWFLAANINKPAGTLLCMTLTASHRRYVRTVASIAALGGLLFGYDTGVMSGALLYISPEFAMTPAQEGRVTAMLLVGAALGAVSGGRVAGALGRRLTLILAAAVFILGSVWCALSGSVFMLTCARGFLGLAVGAVSIVAPMYIAEMVPAGVRGRLVSLNSLMIVVGQLLAYLVNSLLASSGNWHLMLGMAAVPGLLLGVGMLFLPDTPYWYAHRKRFEEAERVAARSGTSLKDFLDDAEPTAGSRRAEWTALKERWLLIAVLIAVGLGITQQVSGVNAVIYFAPTMMNQVGISTENSVYTAIVIGLVSVVACWVGLQIVDKVGRRRLLSIGLAGNVASLVLVAVMFRIAEQHTSLAYLCLALMALFVAFQQAAVSLSTWLLISEIVPVQVRSLGMGVAGLMLWVANWFVAQFFLPMVDLFTATGAFAIFAVLGALSFVFVRVFVPETTGRSLEEVSEDLRARYDHSAASSA